MFKIKGEIHRLIGPMHHSEGEQPKCLQTFFVEATMQANVGVKRFGDIDTHLGDRVVPNAAGE